MKKLYFILFLSTVSVVAYSQGKFWGTSYGIYGDGGKIFKFNPDGSDVKVVKKFDQITGDGSEPFETTLLNGSDGSMYGVTQTGGRFDNGVLYSINYATFNYTKIFDFPVGHDAGPYGGLARGTTSGTANDFIYGYIDKSSPSVFVIKKNGTGYQEFKAPWPMRHAFDRSGLTVGSDGNLYGVGNHPNGTDKSFVFKMTPAGVFTKIHEFALGSTVTGKLLMHSGGKLWGTVNESDGGKIFALNVGDGGNYATIGIPEGAVYNGVIQGSGNALFGVVDMPSAGVDYALFTVATNSTGYTTIHNFDGGQNAIGEIILSGGLIFGATRGSDESANLIYSVSTTGSDFKSVANLSIERGIYSGGVAIDPNSNLFVANSREGEGEFGSVVKVKSTGEDFAIIKQFWKHVDGMVPGTHLELLPSGEILGVAVVGGATATVPYASGVIFRIGTDDSYNIIHEFDGIVGSQPIDAPIAGPGGFYYGVASYAGSYGAGIIYKIKPDGSGFAKIHDFQFATGAEPLGGLVAANGRLYGMARSGGAHSSGTIYGVDPDGSNFDVLLDFDGDNGEEPFYQNLVYHNEFLYGSILGGTGDDGVLFKIKTDGSEYSKLGELNGTGFSFPSTEPFFLANGDVLVVTTNGGDDDRGGILRFNVSDNSFDVIHEFDVELPDANTISNGNLTLGPDGLIYGMEPNGGSEGTGTAFKMNADGSNYTRIELNIDENSMGYMMPWRGFLFVPCVTPEKPVVTVTDATLTSSADEGNQWYLDGEAIDDADEKTYTATVSGSYMVVTTVDGCASASSDAKAITLTDPVTGLEKSNDITVKVFTNPASNEIFLRTSQQSNVSIIDVTGRVIGQYVVNGNTDHRFDISSFSKGLYFLRVENGESVATKRFSKL